MATLCVYVKVGETATGLDVGHQQLFRPLREKVKRPQAMCHTFPATEQEQVVAVLHFAWLNGLKLGRIKTFRKRNTYRPLSHIKGRVWIGVPEEAHSRALNG
jgi:hypothetical protein